MSQLNIFTPANGFYTGVNTPQFTQLEYYTNLSTKFEKLLPNLGLYGEASTGKTSAIKAIAETLDNYTMIYVNGAGLTEQKITSLVLEDMKKLKRLVGTNYLGKYAHSFNEKHQCWTALDHKCLIFIDEAHMLSSDLQTLLLSVLDKITESTENIVRFVDNKEPSFNVKKVSFAFATTDSSKLLYPLTTRLTPITFDQYSKDDIKQMIHLKYPLITDEALGILSNCSKLVPRIALRLAEQITSFHLGETVTESNAVDFAKTFLNMEENGIDALDKRILLYLANHKKKVNPTDPVSLHFFKAQKETF